MSLRSPSIQRVVTNVEYVLGGMLLLGSAFSSINNARNLLTPVVALALTLILLCATLVASLVAHLRGIPWHTGGSSLAVRRLGIKVRLRVFGAIALCWVPSVVNGLRPPQPPAPTPSCAEGPVSTSPASASQFAREQVVLSQLLGKDSSPAIGSARWIDLLGDGQNAELCVEYILSEEDFVDVVTTRHASVARVYHSRRYTSEDGDVTLLYARYAGTPYLLRGSKLGSGGFLSLRMYRWDGIGPLREVWSAQENLFQGWAYEMRDHIFVTGDSRIYELVSAGNSFKLVPYRRRPVFGDFGNAAHILRVDCDGNHLKAWYDSEAITFTGSDDQFVSETVIDLYAGEEMVIDDNQPKPCGLRVLTDAGDLLAFGGGLYRMLSPTGDGECELRFSVNYTNWYGIRIRTHMTTRLRAERRESTTQESHSLNENE